MRTIPVEPHTIRNQIQIEISESCFERYKGLILNAYWNEIE